MPLLQPPRLYPCSTFSTFSEYVCHGFVPSRLSRAMPLVPTAVDRLLRHRQLASYTLHLGRHLWNESEFWTEQSLLSGWFVRFHNRKFYSRRIGEMRSWTSAGNCIQVNGFCTILILGVVSFIMLAFVMYDFRKVVKGWLILSCLLILFGVSGNTLYDFFRRILDQNTDDGFFFTVFLTVSLTLVYGIFGVYVRSTASINTYHNVHRHSSRTRLSCSTSSSSSPTALSSPSFTFVLSPVTPLGSSCGLFSSGVRSKFLSLITDFFQTYSLFYHQWGHWRWSKKKVLTTVTMWDIC